MEGKDDPGGLATDNIQVYARIQPSRDSQARVCAFATSNTTIKLDPKLSGASQPAMGGRGDDVPKSYSYDYVASPHVSQESFFEKVGRPMAEYCLSGYNGCLFAYGQTGSGKTYTIQGPDGVHNDEDKGLTVRILEYIFRKLSRTQRSTQGFNYVCECSYLELYQENVSDLLSEESSTTKLQLHEDLKKGVYVEGLTKIQISSAREAEGLFLCGAKKRQTAPSKANQRSSRSHAIFTIYIQIKETNESGMTAIKSSMLHIVDLAGSERQKNTEAAGARLQEAGIINKSLTHLGKTIRALVAKSEGKNVHVPYRECKLTFLLKQSLGGNSKTSIIVTVDPSAKSYGETLSTLRFADRAKMIRNNAVINERSAGTMVQMQAELKRLQIENVALKSGGINIIAAAGVPVLLNQISPRGGVNAVASDSDREERICELEELLRLMNEKLSRAYADRDNFSAKIKDVLQLLVAKDYFLEASKLVAKLREEKIGRIMRFKDDEDYCQSIEVSQDEISALEKEIESLRYQVDHHPDVIRLSIENLELKEVLEQYEAYYGHNGSELSQLRSLCSKFSTQIGKLVADKTKLIELLKSSADPSDVEGENANQSAHGKIEHWDHEQQIEKLEMDIERIKLEALEKLSESASRESALQVDLDETKLQYIALQEQYLKMEEMHQEEHEKLHEHYLQLTEKVREKHEIQLQQLMEKLEHAKVSSVTVMTMEKQLTAQSDEYIHLKKVCTDMEADLQALSRVLEASWKPLFEDDLVSEELLNRSFGEQFVLSRRLTLNTNNWDYNNDGSKEKPEGLLDDDELLSFTPQKSLFGGTSKSPWALSMTPSTRLKTPGTNGLSTAITPSGRSHHMTPAGTRTPGIITSTLSIPRLAISKIQELQAIVEDYKSKIVELENTMAESDGIHESEVRALDDKLGEQEDRIVELESSLSEALNKESATKEELDHLGSQLDLNTQLLEEKEEETFKALEMQKELENVIAQLQNEKEALNDHSQHLLVQLKSQKDEQVLAMMKRQDELEGELLEMKNEADAEKLANEELRQSLTHAQDRVAKSETQLLRYDATIESLSAQYGEKEREAAQLRARLKDAFAENDSLNQRLDILDEVEENVQILTEEKDELMSACRESCRALRVQTGLTHKLEEKIAADILILEQERQVASCAFAELQRTNDSISQQLNQTQLELNMVQSQVDLVNERFEQQKVEMEQILADNLSLKSTLESTQDNLDSTQDNLDSTQSLLESTRLELVQVKRTMENVKLESATNQSDLIKENANLEALLICKVAEIKELNEELEECHEDLSERKQRLNLLVTEGTQEQKALQSERDELVTELEYSRRSLMQSTDSISALELEVFSSREAQVALEIELAKKLTAKTEEYECLKSQMALDLARFERAQGESIERIGQLTRELKEVKKKSESEELKVLMEQEVLKKAKKIAESETGTLVQSLRSEISMLRDQVGFYEVELTNLKQNVNSVSATSTQREAEVLSAKDQLATLTSHHNDKNKIKYVMQMKSESNALRAEISTLKEEKLALTAQSATVKANNSKLKERVAELEYRLASLQTTDVMSLNAFNDATSSSAANTRAVRSTKTAGKATTSPVSTHQENQADHANLLNTSNRVTRSTTTNSRPTN